MRAHEIITEGRDALLYHGYKDPKYASMAMASGKMAATSTQRFWADGRRRREEVDSDYENSYWMKGLSLTRSMQYAAAWGDIVFALNQATLTQRYKIVPYSWSFHMSGHADVDFRKEGEEFLIVKATPDNYTFPAGHERQGEFDHKRFQSKSQIEGFVPLSGALDGIWMHSYVATMRAPGPDVLNRETYKWDKSQEIVEKEHFQANEMASSGFSIDQFINHPKFKGFFLGGRRNDPPGFKFFAPDTPRSELPPRPY